MNRRALTLAWLLVLGAGMAGAATAPSSSWPIDAAQSQVHFSVRKFLFAHEQGTFPGMTGRLQRIDTHIGADLGQVDAEVNVAGLRMDDADDRERALGYGFFDAAQFPVIQFQSDPFPLDELASGGVLRGILTLRGEQHPVKLALQASDCPRQPLECVIRVKGDISRSAFGMHGWRGVLSDNVALDLRIRLIPREPP